jgi:hypothetical protein
MFKGTCSHFMQYELHLLFVVFTERKIKKMDQLIL